MMNRRRFVPSFLALATLLLAKPAKAQEEEKPKKPEKVEQKFAVKVCGPDEKEIRDAITALNEAGAEVSNEDWSVCDNKMVFISFLPTAENED